MYFFINENLNLANKIGDELLLETNFNDRSFYIKGSIKYRESDFENAFEYFEKAISKNPKELLYQQEIKRLMENIEKFKKDLLIIGKVPKLLINQNSNEIWNFFIKKYNLQVNGDDQIKRIKNN